MFCERFLKYSSVRGIQGRGIDPVDRGFTWGVRTERDRRRPGLSSTINFPKNSDRFEYWLSRRRNGWNWRNKSHKRLFSRWIWWSMCSFKWPSAGHDQGNVNHLIDIPNCCLEMCIAFLMILMASNMNLYPARILKAFYMRCQVNNLPCPWRWQRPSCLHFG